MAINFSLLLITLTVLGNLFLAFLVLFRDPRKRTHQLFFVFTLTLSAWVTSSYLANEPLGEGLQDILLRADFVSALSGSYLFLLFTSYFPRRRDFLGKSILQVLFLITLLFLLMIVATGLIIGKTEIVEAGISYHPGPLDIPYALLIFLMIGGGALTLIKQYQQSEGHERLQTLYIVIAAIIPVSIISLTNLFLERLLLNLNVVSSPLVVSVVPRTGLYSTLFFTLVTTYAILRHRLFGIRIILGKTLFWSGIAGFLFAVFYAVALAEQGLIGSFVTPTALLINLLLAFGVALVFSVFEKNLRCIIDRYFIHFSFDPNEIIDQFIIDASAKLTSEELGKLLFETVHKTLEPEKQGLLATPVKPNHGKVFASWENLNSKEFPQLETEETIETLLGLRLHGRSFLQSESAQLNLSANLSRLLQTLGIEVVLPLYDENLQGVYLLGKKVNHQAYTAEDLGFLENLTFYAGLNLQRTLS